MIDLHCHILPNVDDGADCLDTSLEMAVMAWQTGTNVLVATPHFSRPDQSQRLPVDAYRRGVARLSHLLRQQGCGLKLTTGMEVFATPELPCQLNEKALLTLADSHYLLVEFYFDETEAFMESSLRAIERQGLIPVVAHPERYEAVQRTPELAAEWFSRGYLLQLNKGTILGRMGSQSQQTAWWLLRRGLAHVVASDAHSARYRTPSLAHVFEMVGQELSWEYAQILLEENPARVIQDRPPVPAGRGRG